MRVIKLNNDKHFIFGWTTPLTLIIPLKYTVNMFNYVRLSNLCKTIKFTKPFFFVPCVVINSVGLCIKKDSLETHKGSKGWNNGFPHHREQLLPSRHNDIRADIMTYL